MEQQFSGYYEDLMLLNDYLEQGIEQNWSHELLKQILLLLHKLKSNSRKLANTEIESELIAIEVTLGYGSGPTKKPDALQIEDHQLRLLELTESSNNSNNETDYAESEQSDEEDSTKDAAGEICPTTEIQEAEIDKIMTEPHLTGVQLILCNCPGRDAARELARNLLKARLAACVNIIANIGSIYWWQGEIKDTAECQLQIKTSTQSLEDVIQFIKNNHPADVPEILAIEVDKGNQEYFDWVKQETYARE